MKLYICFAFLSLTVFPRALSQSQKHHIEIIENKYESFQKDKSLVFPDFISLPLGSIKPLGWIEDQANLALDGITGHLDEYSAVHRLGWNGKSLSKSEVGSESDGTGWILEQSAYWLDGAISLSSIMNDRKLFKRVSARLDSIVDGVLDGANTLIYWKSKDIVKNNEFNSWAHSHVARALLAYYQSTGNEKILNALCKVYSDYPLPPFPKKNEVVSGIVNLDPMYQTYLLSGDKKILDNIRRYVESEQYKTSIKAWNNGEFPIEHGVIMYENIRIPEISYLVTGDKTHLNATLNFFKMLSENHDLPSGISSSEEWLAGIGSTRNVETCNVACAPLSYQLAYEITGNGKYGDRLEKIFFNAAPSCVSNDYKNVVYYQSLNKVEGVLPGEFPSSPMDVLPKGERISAYEYWPTGHSVLCCVGNMTRVIPNYIKNMWMRTKDNGLASVLHGPNVVNTIIGEDNTSIKIVTETNYPFSEQITYKINPEKSITFPFYIRIPEWSDYYKIEVNGEKINTELRNGFVKVEKDWKQNDKVNVRFKMKICLEEGKETSFPDNSYHKRSDGDVGRGKIAFKKDISNPYQTISYGPLLFSYPIKEISFNKQIPNVKWKYALNVKDLSKDVKVYHYSMPSYWSWSMKESPIVLEVKATPFDWKVTPEQPIPKSNIEDGKSEFIKLVPYGCTHFRITMFPFVK